MKPKRGTVGMAG